MKKLLKFVFVLLLLLVIAVVAIPYFFKDELVQKAKTELNNQVNAKVDFKDVDLSLLWSFPAFTFSLTDFVVDGIDDFEGTRLVEAKGIRFQLDLMSVIKTDRPIEIHSISLIEPNVNIQILKDGKTNYDIVKATEGAVEEKSEAGSFQIELEDYNIENGNIIYNDRPGRVYLELLDLNHSGKGDFSEVVYDLETTTKINSITVGYNGLNYISKAKGDMKVVLNADMDRMKFTLKDNRIVLNDLLLKSEGFVSIKGSDYNFDLNFDAPENNFKSFLSLVPAAYTKDFSDVKANGQLAFNGFVKGNYNAERESSPAFELNLDIDQADFKYPSLPLGVTDIFAKAKIKTPGGKFDNITVDLPDFKMNMGGQPIEARLNVSNPISDPYVDAYLKGRIEMAELNKVFPLEDVKKLDGVLTADFVTKTSMSAIDRQDYEKIDMSGDLKIEGIHYETEGLPAVFIKDMDMSFNPRNAEIKNFEAKLGDSDVLAKGSVDNILALFSTEKMLSGKLDIRSNYFNANEWLAEETASEEASSQSSTAESAVFDRFDFDVAAIVTKMDYLDYQLDNLEINGNLTANDISLTKFKTDLGSSDFSGSGKIGNFFPYLYENKDLTGKININSRFVNLNEFMEDPNESDQGAAKKIAGEEDLGPVPIPERMDIAINAKIDKLKYTNLDLRKVSGDLLIKDEAVKIKNSKSSMLGGTMAMNGIYDTKNIDKPGFDLDVNVKNFDFQKAFKDLNTFQTLAPIGKFIQGNFNTDIKINGLLGKDLSPDYSTLTVDGFFQTINGVLKNFEPVEKMSGLLNLDFLKTMSIKDTKNWVEVKNGKVEVKPFDTKYKDIDFNIGGTHGFDEAMKYIVKAKVPRAMLEKSGVGKVATKGIGFLEKEAGKLGINLKAGEFINVQFDLTGSMKSPKVKMKLLGTEKGASIVDVGKEIINDKIDNIQDNAQARLDAEKVKLNAEMEKKIAAVMAAAKKQRQSLLDEGKKKAELAKKLGYEQADKLVANAGNNIFKKKGAELASNKLKKETDKKVDKIYLDYEKRTEVITDKAKAETDKIRGNYKKRVDGLSLEDYRKTGG